MNIKVKVSQGLQGEFNKKLGAIYEQEIQKRVDAALEDIVDEIVEEVEQEIEEMEERHNKDLLFLGNLASLAEELAGAVIKSQVKELEELDATLQEAEARIDRLAADKRDLMERIHELEMENKRLAEHCQKVEAEAIYAQLDAADTKKVDKPKKAKVTPKAADPKAYESVDSLFKFLFGEVEDL